MQDEAGFCFIHPSFFLQKIYRAYRANCKDYYYQRNHNLLVNTCAYSAYEEIRGSARIGIGEVRRPKWFEYEAKVVDSIQKDIKKWFKMPLRHFKKNMSFVVLCFFLIITNHEPFEPAFQMFGVRVKRQTAIEACEAQLSSVEIRGSRVKHRNGFYAAHGNGETSACVARLHRPCWALDWILQCLDEIYGNL